MVRCVAVSHVSIFPVEDRKHANLRLQCSGSMVGVAATVRLAIEPKGQPRAISSVAVSDIRPNPRVMIRRI